MTSEQPAFELKNLGLLRRERWILRDVDWTVRSGTCAAILGPNGSGKSTLARVLACHLWPSKGDVSVLGGRFGEANLPEVRKQIRLVQPAGPYDVDPELTTTDVVVSGFFGSLALYQRVTEEMRETALALLDQVGLSAVAKSVYSTLSSGERVRSLIARALVCRPRLLLLDEPTSGLDLLAREQVLATIEGLYAEADPPTVVLITHHVEELPPVTSNIVLLDNGAVAASGRPESVLRSEVLSGVYRCPLQVRNAGGRYYVEVHPAAWERLLSRRDATPAEE
jgi:iron complex transport system ATP-binding protein